MTTTIPECSKIQAAHLGRVAYVYVRQSSPYQVENNKESGYRQYNLVESLVTLGWPRDRVVVVDDDQGRSSSTPKSRDGFQEMARAVARSEFGIVMALEASRLARNNPDWHSLVYVCRLYNTLLRRDHIWSHFPVWFRTLRTRTHPSEHVARITLQAALQQEIFGPHQGSTLLARIVPAHQAATPDPHPLRLVPPLNQS